MAQGSKRGRRVEVVRLTQRGVFWVSGGLTEWSQERECDSAAREEASQFHEQGGKAHCIGARRPGWGGGSPWLKACKLGARMGGAHHGSVQIRSVCCKMRLVAQVQHYGSRGVNGDLGKLWLSGPVSSWLKAKPQVSCCQMRTEPQSTPGSKANWRCCSVFFLARCSSLLLAQRPSNVFFFFGLWIGGPVSSWRKANPKCLLPDEDRGSVVHLRQRGESKASRF